MPVLLDENGNPVSPASAAQVPGGVLVDESGMPLTHGDVAETARQRIMQREGLTPEDVKRRAASGERITTGGPRAATIRESMLSGVAAGVAGVGDALGGTLGLVTDIGRVIAPDPGETDPMKFTKLGTAAADDAQKTLRRGLGVPDAAITDVSDATTRLVTAAVTPLPGLKGGARAAAIREATAARGGAKIAEEAIPAVERGAMKAAPELTAEEIALADRAGEAQAVATPASQTVEQAMARSREAVSANNARLPETLYHRSHRAGISELEPATAPQWGSGIYLAEGRNAAENFGPNVYEVAADLKNPYVAGTPILDAVETTNAWKKVSDKWAEPRDAWQEDGQFVGEALRELGYDGVIDRNSQFGTEVVVFNKASARIKAAHASPDALGAAPAPDGAKAGVAPEAATVPTEGTGATGFDAKAYVEEQVGRREAARRQGAPSGAGKVGALLSEIKQKLVDSNAPIEDLLSSTLKKEGIELLPSRDITNAIDRVYRAPSIAGQFARDNGIENVIREVPDLDMLDQYLIAKHAQTIEATGRKTGRDLRADAQLIASAKETYEPFAKRISDYSQKLLDYATESGLVPEELATKLKANYPDYVPLQRVFSEIENVRSQGGSNAVASLSSQTVVRKLAGSEREIESPIESLMSKTSEAFVQGEKNKAAKILASYHDLPGNPFQLEPLRLAENVKQRIQIFTELRDLGQQNRAFRGTLETIGRQFESADSSFSRQIGRVRERLASAQDEADAIYELAQTRAAELADSPEITRLLNKGVTRERRMFEMQGRLEQIANGPAARRRADLAAWGNQFTDLLAEGKTDVKELRAQIASVRDVKAQPGEYTISFLNDGIRETWKTSKEIAEAAKALDVQRLGVLGRILSAPVRVARVGITGINPAFLASNIVKDQLTGFINSARGVETLANPATFSRALFDALGHGEFYDEMVRAGGAGTSFDMAREQIPRTIADIRSQRSVSERVAFIATNPSRLLRTAEDLLARGEEFTRLLHARAAKKAALAQGLPESEATIAAARAFRETTVNFARRGEWGTVLNSTFLYLNANIQGTRTLLRGLQARPIATSAKIATAVFLPVAIVTAWNMNDPERRKVYEDVADFEKENNIVIVPPNPTQDERGRYKVIKIPLSQEVNNLARVPRRVLEHAFGSDPVRAGEIAEALIGTVSPVGTSKGQIASTIVPQGAKVPAELMLNKNFFTGRDIVPENDRAKAAKEELTGGTARQVAKLAGVSPIQVEEAVRETFGGTGTQALNAADWAVIVFGGKQDWPVGGESSIEAIRRRFSRAYGGEVRRRARAKAIREATQKP